MYLSVPGNPLRLIQATSVSRAGASSGLDPADKMLVFAGASAFPKRPLVGLPRLIAPADVALNPFPELSGVLGPGFTESRCHCPASGDAARAGTAEPTRTASEATRIARRVTALRRPYLRPRAAATPRNDEGPPDGRPLDPSLELRGLALALALRLALALAVVAALTLVALAL